MDKAGARVVQPIFLHNSMSSAYCRRTLAKKRDYFYHLSVSEQSQQTEQLQLPFKDTGNDWNPNSWQWDSSRFVVRPLELEILWPGIRQEENKGMDDSNKLPAFLEQNAGGVGNVEDDDDRLRLNLGGGMKFAEESASRPNKKIRSGSAGDTYPICQVDDCNEDLSNVKDYHRRHKVCEVHSKSANALVGKQVQRFCQQCSRFHLLSEFDEGKRSCRHRLAGHSRRRRKTQSEDVNLSLPCQGNQVRNINENVDIVHLLHSLAHGKGKAQVNGLSGLGGEQIVNFLGKKNSLKLPVDLATKLQSYRNNSATASFGKFQLNHQDRFNTNSSTADLLAVLSSMRPAPSPNDTVAVPSQSGEINGSERKNKSKSADESVDTVLEKGPAVDRSSVAGERSSTGYQSLLEYSDGQIQQTRPSLQLQLFTSSPEDDSPPKLASSEKYFSSEGSNPVEEWSPSSSLVAQELFPMQSLREAAVSERTMLSSGIKENDNVRFDGRVMPLDLFRDSVRVFDDTNAQNRTGRIMFKLFNKDPSH